LVSRDLAEPTVCRSSDGLADHRSQAVIPYSWVPANADAPDGYGAGRPFFRIPRALTARAVAASGRLAATPTPARSIGTTLPWRPPQRPPLSLGVVSLGRGPIPLGAPATRYATNPARFVPVVQRRRLNIHAALVAQFDQRLGKRSPVHRPDRHLPDRPDSDPQEAERHDEPTSSGGDPALRRPVNRGFTPDPRTRVPGPIPSHRSRPAWRD